MSTKDPHAQKTTDALQQRRFRNFGSDTPSVMEVTHVGECVVLEVDLGALIDGLPNTSRASVRHYDTRLEVQRRNAWTMSIAGTEATIVDVDGGELPERVPDWLRKTCELVGMQRVEIGRFSDGVVGARCENRNNCDTSTDGIHFQKNKS